MLTDFDGTLAPIVDDPATARALPGAVDVLRELAARFGLVGVISGRPVRFLLDQVGDQGGVRLFGLYGLQSSDSGVVVERPEGAAWREAVDGIVARAGTDLHGVGVEHKGLSVTLHVRSAPDAAPAVLAWATRVAGETGMALEPGRMSVELRPPVLVDKGTVVTDLVTGFDAACFLGDDRGDLAAFAALDRMREVGIHAVKVAVQSAEAPAELLAQADLVVDGPPAALEVLRRLGRAHTAG